MYPISSRYVPDIYLLYQVHIGYLLSKYQVPVVYLPSTYQVHIGYLPSKYIWNIKNTYFLKKLNCVYLLICIFILQNYLVFDLQPANKNKSFLKHISSKVHQVCALVVLLERAELPACTNLQVPHRLVRHPRLRIALSPNRCQVGGVELQVFGVRQQAVVEPRSLLGVPQQRLHRRRSAGRSLLVPSGWVTVTCQEAAHHRYAAAAGS